MVLFYLIPIAYLIAVNVYGFCPVKTQTDESEEGTSNDKKMFFAGLLGGALTVYIFLFVYRFRLKSALLMITLPILIVLDVYLAFLFFRSGIFRSGIVMPSVPMGDRLNCPPLPTLLSILIN